MRQRSLTEANAMLIEGPSLRPCPEISQGVVWLLASCRIRLGLKCREDGWFIPQLILVTRFEQRERD
jgi:hypothetical protein